MNILFTCSARKWGGNEAWVLHAADVMAKKHHCLLAYRKDEIGERFNIKKFQLPFHHEADLYTLARLISIIKEHHIDIVVPTKRKDYFLAGIACKLTKAKNILILGIVRDLKNKGINELVYHRLADGIMVNAHMIKDVLLQSSYMKSKNIAVIPNGLFIDVNKIEAIEKKFDFTITSLGELSERKGFDFLITGFALFVSQNSIDNAGLIIIGTGGQLDALKELTRSLNIERLVTFTGFIKNPYPYLATSDIFALTSRNEGIPYATLEAALLDNAIITTRAGGVEEVLTHNQHCLFVEYGEEQSLADHLMHLYRDVPFRKKIACEAKSVAVEQFSLEKMEKEMIEFFRFVQQ